MTRGIPFHIQPAQETVNDVVTRNNLFIGTRGPALLSTGRMFRCDFDSDGYGWSMGPFALWNEQTFRTPQAAKTSGALYGRRGAIVVNPQRIFASGLLPPANVAVRYPIHQHDPRLARGSAAIDAGVVLPNFNDGFVGKAPDLGCCELGQPLPQYGPRPSSRTAQGVVR